MLRRSTSNLTTARSASSTPPTSRTGPKSLTLPDIASALDDYTGREAIAAGEAFDPSPSNIEQRTTRYTLSNGMEVALLPKATRGQTVNLGFRVILGDEEALTGRTTAGSIAGQMLMRGSSGHTRQQIQDELDRLQATGSVGGMASQAFGSVQTTRENMDDVMRLMAEIVREPSFPRMSSRRSRSSNSPDSAAALGPSCPGADRLGSAYEPCTSGASELHCDRRGECGRCGGRHTRRSKGFPS